MSKIEQLKDEQLEHEEQKFLLAIESGLVYSGVSEDGEHEYIGTKRQWEIYDDMLTKAGL